MGRARTNRAAGTQTALTPAPGTSVKTRVTAGAERLMLEHIGSVESALGKWMPGKADAREQLRATVAPVSKPKLARA